MPVLAQARQELDQHDGDGQPGGPRGLPQLPGEAIWVINCFVVARKARGRGIADALRAAAVEYAASHGAQLVEGFPVETDGERLPSASAYTGTRSMFERAGFDEVARSTSKAPGGRPPVVMRRGT